MIYKVELSEFLLKQIRKRQVPQFVLKKFKSWLESVKVDGLEDTRKIPGYHDEPLQGKLAGMRSIRLSDGWRAYYIVHKDLVEFVKVERIDKHGY